jgi:hypothetical protein
MYVRILYVHTHIHTQALHYVSLLRGGAHLQRDPRLHLRLRLDDRVWELHILYHDGELLSGPLHPDALAPEFRCVYAHDGDEQIMDGETYIHIVCVCLFVCLCVFE